ncbi:MAG TPA: DUF3298 domain-containing protein [Pyrinomonadaceae bacterium]|nr:DUF3298 domain-containing protein [Pyrinomonadaceae bacterium]
MRRRLKTFLHLTLALLALSAGDCLHARPSIPQAGAAARRSQTTSRARSQKVSPSPASVRRAPERFFKDAIKFDGTLHFTDQKLGERSERYKYEIGLVYPRLAGGARPARVNSFNRTVAAVLKEVGNFRAWTQGTKDTRGKRPSEWADVFDTLYGDYDVTYASDELISIRFDLYTFGWGAARSTQHYLVFNYALASGRRLALSDLFRPEAKYLRVIADFCVADLRRQRKAVCENRDPRDCEPPSEISPTHPNLSPLPGNFRNWNLTRTGLLMNFDECRLASCIEGEQFVTIPYAELKHLAPAKGIIAQLAQGGNE